LVIESGGFGDALDQAERQGARAEGRDQKHRQQAMDELGRDAHEQADQAESQRLR
jgi:hypothetical protein